jgi:hypothetical protein
MNRQTAQSIGVVVFGAGVWILLLGITEGLFASIGATAVAFGLIVIADRLLENSGS